jgi:hypothetical protein
MGPSRFIACVVAAVGGLVLLACAPIPPPTATPAPKPTAAAAAAPASANTPVAAPSGASITFTAPAAGASVPAGDVAVAIDIAGVTLVPAADARKPDDFHVHVFLDVDPAPYVGTTVPIPVGNPAIVHTAAKDVTFKDVKPGEHKLAVVLTSPDHVSVRPPVTAASTFTAK